MQPKTSSAKTKKNSKKTSPCVVRQYTHRRKTGEREARLYIFSKHAGGDARSAVATSSTLLRIQGTRGYLAYAVHTSIRISNHNNETLTGGNKYCRGATCFGLCYTDSPEPPLKQQINIHLKTRFREGGSEPNLPTRSPRKRGTAEPRPETARKTLRRGRARRGCRPPGAPEAKPNTSTKTVRVTHGRNSSHGSNLIAAQKIQPLSGGGTRQTARERQRD